MPTFLFWNLKERPRLDALVRLVELHRVDVVMLAECGLDTVQVLERLNSAEGAKFHHNIGSCERIVIYSKFINRHIQPVIEDHRMSVRRLKHSTDSDLLLAVVHLQSKLHQSGASQAMATTEIARTIRRAERKVGHERTVVVGDLNMQPFEDGIVGAAGFHAVMDRRVAMRGKRVIDGKEHIFLYNPMWSMFGDASQGPPGTFYQSRSEHVAYFWHMFDQVLIRPDLLPVFDNADLQILTHDGATSFLTGSGTPDDSVASDHLPVLFKLRC